MDIAPSKVKKIILYYDDCRSIEMRPDKIICHGTERQTIMNAVNVIETVCIHQAIDCFKKAP